MSSTTKTLVFRSFEPSIEERGVSVPTIDGCQNQQMKRPRHLERRIPEPCVGLGREGGCRVRSAACQALELKIQPGP